MQNKHYKAWLIAFSAVGYFFFSIMQLSLFNVGSSFIIQELNISSVKFSIISSYYLYALAITLLPAGYLIDCFSTKKIAMITMLLSVLSVIGLACYQSLSTLILYRIITGIANGFAFLIVLRVAMIWFSKYKALASGVVIALGMSGGIFSTLLYTQLAKKYDWNYVLYFNAAFGLLLFIILVFLIENHQDELKKGFNLSLLFTKLKAVASNVNNWYCGVYTGCLNLSVYVMASLWGNIFLTQKYQLDNTAASIIISMIFLGIIIGSPLWGILSDSKYGKGKSMLTGALTSTIIILFLVFITDTNTNLLLLIFLLLGLTTSSQVISYSFIAEHTNINLISTATGFAALIINIIGALAQPLFTKLLNINWDGRSINNIPIYSESNWNNALLLLAGAFLTATLVSLVINRKIILQPILLKTEQQTAPYIDFGLQLWLLLYVYSFDLLK